MASSAALFANARMYAVSPAAADAWRRLFLGVAALAAEPLEVIDYPAPAPLTDLWSRPNKGAVFICGLPFSRSVPRPQLLAAPTPAPAEFCGRPEYWSEFVVRADSAHYSLADTFGARLAFTSSESQSGFAAPLRHLRQFARAEPLFATVIAPQITPQGAVRAVADGLADVAGIDAYSLRLLRRYEPQLASRVRVVERTEARPIPPLISSQPQPRLAAALLAAHTNPAIAAGPMAELLLQQFDQPDPREYQRLSTEWEDTLAFWRQHRIASELHPAFELLISAASEFSCVS